MPVSAILQRLTAAVARVDLEAASKEVEELVAAAQSSVTSVDQAAQKEAFALLRRARWFSLMRRLGAALRACGSATSLASRQYGQALIELNEFDGALGVFGELVGDPTCPDKERVEAEGLIGRVHKQRYVDFVTPAGSDPADSLRRAIAAYDAVYRRDPKLHTWHGINVVALLARAVRDSVLVTTIAETPKALAATILENTRDAQDGWSLATAAEACVALAEWKDALAFAERYVVNSDIDAFACASTLRQLKQVWLLTEDGCGGALLTLLQAAVLNCASNPQNPLYQRAGAAISFGVGELGAARAGVEASASMLERVFGAAGFRSIEWVRKSLERARAVARIETATGRGIGTGFLVARSSLFGAVENGDELVLVTNAHVLGTTSSRALRLPDAVIRFQDIDSQGTLRAKEILFESKEEELDVCVVRLDGAVIGVQPYELSAAELPMDPEHPRLLYVIGYPLGGTLSLSYEDNVQLDWRSPKVHYRTPTEPGSSGSPVFDESWRLVGVHHAGSKVMPRLHGEGTYSANEGIWIQAVVRAIAARTAAAPAEAVTASPGVRPPFRNGIFVSYAHADRDWLVRLQTYLKPLTLDGAVDIWDDHRLSPGGEWRAEIDREMASASVAILLVSASFLASDFILKNELRPLLRANAKRGLVVAPIAVGRSRYDLIPELEKKQFLNDPARPLVAIADKPGELDAAFDQISRQIGRLLDVTRLSNSFHAMDAVTFQASGFGGKAASDAGVSSMGALATQVGRDIVVRGAGSVVIRWEQVSQLADDERQLIYAYDASIQKLVTAYNEEFPNRLSTNPVTRDRALRVVRESRAQLCKEFNELLDFFASLRHHLDDHYRVVRFLCTRSGNA